MAGVMGKAEWTEAERAATPQERVKMRRKATFDSSQHSTVCVCFDCGARTVNAGDRHREACFMWIREHYTVMHSKTPGPKRAA